MWYDIFTVFNLHSRFLSFLEYKSTYSTSMSMPDARLCVLMCICTVQREACMLGFIFQTPVVISIYENLKMQRAPNKQRNWVDLLSFKKFSFHKSMEQNTETRNSRTLTNSTDFWKRCKSKPMEGLLNLTKENNDTIPLSNVLILPA